MAVTILANLFDRSNYPTQEPASLAAGDRWTWKRPDLVGSYPTSLYSLSYEFQDDAGGGSANNFTITALETTEAYIVEVISATTAAYSPSTYRWAAFITTSDSQRVTVDTGFLAVEANYAITTADQRSHAKKVLDNIKAVMENRATIDQSSFSIAGRSLSRMSVDELFTYRDRYQTEYNQEIKRARIKNKKPTGNTIGVRF